MRLNTIKPGVGSKSEPKRRGRGRGTGLGKTAGRGHKGQKARSGGFHKVGFEGGQMPLQRRLPKRGFTAPFAHRKAQVRLGELDKVEGDIIDLAALKKANIIGGDITSAKVFLSGEIKKAVTLKGIPASKGAVAAITEAGGKVEA